MSQEVVVEACRSVWHAVPEQSRADLSRSALERGVKEAVQRGWTTAALVAYLGRDLDRERIPAATVHSRLRELPALDPPTIRVDKPDIPFDLCAICACGANVTLGHPHVAGCGVVDELRPPAAKPLSTGAVAAPEHARAAIQAIRADLASRRAS